jgi:hypothetical protein
MIKAEENFVFRTQEVTKIMVQKEGNLIRIVLPEKKKDIHNRLDFRQQKERKNMRYTRYQF